MIKNSIFNQRKKNFNRLISDKNRVCSTNCCYKLVIERISCHAWIKRSSRLYTFLLAKWSFTVSSNQEIITLFSKFFTLFKWIIFSFKFSLFKKSVAKISNVSIFKILHSSLNLKLEQRLIAISKTKTPRRKRKRI